MQALLGVWLGAASAASVAQGVAPAPTIGVDAATAIVEGRATVYPSSYFSRFGPTTALDIAQRVPGFSLDRGNNEVRGFAGTAGNVVINGARPSSKADSLTTVLARIPARQVLRVELGPGDLYGADYRGKPQVLNIVLGSVGGLSGTVSATARRRFTGDIVPDGQASLLWKRGASSLNLAAGFDRTDSVEEGTDRLLTVADGSLLEFRRKVNRIRDREPFASANWALEQAPNRAIRVNIRFSPGRFRLDQTNRVVPADGPPRDDRLRQDFRSRSFEVGGDVTRPLLGGALKLVGLANRERRDRFEGLFERDREEVIGGFEQEQLADRDERIGRLNWTREALAGMRIEVGAETALNTLDSDVAFVELSPGGGRTRIDLPIDQARVRERRGELFVNVGKQISGPLRIEAGLAFETSRLTVSGDTSARRSLSFAKPSVSVDWRAKSGWHVQASLKRTVAQLDFYDFISTAELSSDRVNAGNAELVPQRAWELRGTLERPLLNDGLAKIDIGYDRIDLLQDRILTPEGFDAPGNLGTGTRRFAALTLDLPLTVVGLKGARLKANGQVQSTRVPDPVSGTRRRFSGFWPAWEWSLDYRHDLGRWAYGATLSDRARFSYVRIVEIDTNRNSQPFLTAFVDYRPNKATTVTLDVDNFLATRGERIRLFSFPSRAAASSLVELRQRNTHPTVSLTVKRTFG